MKIIHLFPDLIENGGAIIASFGNARLMKTPDGAYELVGGSKSDHLQASEWISLFMHEAVVGNVPLNPSPNTVACARSRIA